MPILSNFQSGAGGAGGSLNVFAQTTQPSEQEGLWIKSDNVNNIEIGYLEAANEQYLSGEIWSKKPTYSVVLGKDNIAYFDLEEYNTYSGDYYRYVYKRDMETGITTKLSDYSLDGGTALVYFGDFVYAFSDEGSHKINVDTGAVSSVGLNFWGYCNANTFSFAMGENNVGYILNSEATEYDDGSYSDHRAFYKYDFNADTYVSMQLPSIIQGYGYSIYYLDGILYFFGGTHHSERGYTTTDYHKIYAWDINANTAREITTNNLVNSNSQVFYFGNKFYLFNRKTGASTVKIDTTNWTATYQEGLQESSTGMKLPAFVYDNKVYLFTSLGTQIYVPIAHIGEIGDTVAQISTISPFVANLISDPQQSLTVRIKGVYQQKANGVVKIPAAVINNGVITDILDGTEPQPETWYFNDDPSWYSKTYTVNFECNGSSFTQIEVSARTFIYRYGSSRTVVRDEGVWLSELARTIVLEEPATGEFLTFLQENATKQ